jgi:multidrug efflux pump subunit AcrA (membrane-fusion protein)
MSEIEAYRVPGFGWVRGFTAAILVVSILLVSGVFSLITLAEMDVTVSGPGSIEPIKRFHIKAGIEGTIRSVLVKSGDRVSQGQIVAELDDTALTSQLEKVERDLDANRFSQQEYLHRRERDLALFEAERRQASARKETAALQLEQVSREYRLYYD